jgi:hypothetical protein
MIGGTELVNKFGKINMNGQKIRALFMMWHISLD